MGLRMGYVQFFVKLGARARHMNDYLSALPCPYSCSHMMVKRKIAVAKTMAADVASAYYRAVCAV